MPLDLDRILEKLKNNRITTLSITNENLDPSDCQRIAKALTGNTSLKSLELLKNKICDEGCRHIADALKLIQPESPLETLNMWGNNIGDLGVNYLKKAFDHNHYLTVKIKLCECEGYIETTKEIEYTKELHEASRKNMEKKLQYFKSIKAKMLCFILCNKHLNKQEKTPLVKDMRDLILAHVLLKQKPEETNATFKNHFFEKAVRDIKPIATAEKKENTTKKMSPCIIN